MFSCETIVNEQSAGLRYIVSNVSRLFVTFPRRRRHRHPSDIQ